MRHKSSLSRAISLVVFAYMSAFAATAQKIYSVNHEYQADVKVFVVDAEYKADLVVFKTDREYKAKAPENKGIWFITPKQYQADKKVFFTDKEYKADLKVFFTDKEYKAGWKSSEKKPLMY